MFTANVSQKGNGLDESGWLHAMAANYAILVGKIYTSLDLCDNELWI
jgi:hypothetical protein